jgi:hypothetical protein
MSYKDILKNRRKNVMKQAEAVVASKKKGYDDDRFWKYEMDKSGNAFAVIRFLPPTEDDIKWYAENKPEISPDTIPFYGHIFEHNFKNKGKYFKQNCPTSWKDGKCPVCEYNSKQIESTGVGFRELPDSHEVKKGVRNRKRKDRFFANILVIKDPTNPNNEGKVFLFEYGAIIQQMIENKLIVDEMDDSPSIDVADPFEGCNFKLKVYKKDDFVKYDRSEWEAQSEISDDEDEMFDILSKGYAIHPFFDDSAKPNMDTFNKYFNRAMGIGDEVKAPQKDVETPSNNSDTLDDDDELDSIFAELED